MDLHTIHTDLFAGGEVDHPLDLAVGAVRARVLVVVVLQVMPVDDEVPLQVLGAEKAARDLLAEFALLEGSIDPEHRVAEAALGEVALRHVRMGV